MSVPKDALEASIEAEIKRLGEGDEPPADETPAEEPPPEGEEPEEEVEEGEEPGEGEDEGEEEEAPPAAAAPGKKPKKPRENETIRALRERAQAAEARLAADEARRAQEEAERRNREAQEAMRREDAELNALPPEEQPARRQEIFNKRLAAETLRIRAQLSDQMDSNQFRANAESDPVLKAVAPMVENIAQQFIRAGHTVNRDTIADNVIGRLARTGQLQRLLNVKTQAKPKKRIPAGRAQGGGGAGTRKSQRSAEDLDRAALMKRIGNKPI